MIDLHCPDCGGKTFFEAGTLYKIILTCADANCQAKIKVKTKGKGN